MWIRNPKVASSSMAHRLGYKARTNLINFMFVSEPYRKINSALEMLDPQLPRDEAYSIHKDNYHLTPQWELLQPFKGHVHFIGHFETLDEDWEVIQYNLGVGPLPHLNKGNPREWSDWSFTGDRYERDFELCRLSSY